LLPACAAAAARAAATKQRVGTQRDRDARHELRHNPRQIARIGELDAVDLRNDFDAARELLLESVCRLAGALDGLGVALNQQVGRVLLARRCDFQVGESRTQVGRDVGGLGDLEGQRFDRARLWGGRRLDGRAERLQRLLRAHHIGVVNLLIAVAAQPRDEVQRFLYREAAETDRDRAFDIGRGEDVRA
jgi:hypothetical protein